MLPGNLPILGYHYPEVAKPPGYDTRKSDESQNQKNKKDIFCFSQLLGIVTWK